MTIPNDDVAAVVNAQLEQISRLEADIDTLALNRDQEIAGINQKYHQLIDAKVKLRDDVARQVMEMFKRHRKRLLDSGLKTANLRAGKLSTRWSTVSIDVTDKDVAIAYLRRHRLLGKFARRVLTWTVDKNRLRDNLELARKIPGIIVIEPVETLTIKPEAQQAEVERDAKPLQFTL